MFSSAGPRVLGIGDLGVADANLPAGRHVDVEAAQRAARRRAGACGGVSELKRHRLSDGHGTEAGESYPSVVGGVGAGRRDDHTGFLAPRTFGASLAFDEIEGIGAGHPLTDHPVGAAGRGRDGVDQGFDGQIIGEHHFHPRIALDSFGAREIEAGRNAFGGRANARIGGERGVLRYAQCHQQGENGHADDQLDQAETAVAPAQHPPPLLVTQQLEPAPFQPVATPVVVRVLAWLTV